MKKFIKITAILLLTLFVLSLLAYFLAPRFINLDPIVKNALKDVEKQTGLLIDIENTKVETLATLKAKVFLEGIKVNHNDNSKLFNAKNLSLSVDILPFIFKRAEIKDINISKPEVYLVRDKKGNFKIQKLIDSQKNQDNKEEFKLVLSGLKVESDDYLLTLKDNKLSTPKTFVIKGESLKVPEFSENKKVKFLTKGQVLVNNNPHINYDFGIEANLPKEINDQEPLKLTNPLEAISTYNLKADMLAKLKLRDLDKTPKIDGNVNIDKLSLKIGNENINNNYAKLTFKGSSFDIDSKINIDSNSYVLVNGNGQAGKKLNLKVKTTKLNLPTVKRFALAVSDIANIDRSQLAKVYLDGTVIADFTVDTNFKKSEFKGFLNASNISFISSDFPGKLTGTYANIKFDKDKIIIEKLYGNLDKSRFNAAGNLELNKNLALNNIKLTVDKNTLFLDGVVKNLADNPTADISLTGSLNLAKNKKYFPQDIRNNLVLKGSLPLNVSFKGNDEKFDVNIKSQMDRSNYIMHTVSLDLKEPKKLNFNINAGSKDLDISGSIDRIQLSGQINNYKSKNPRLAIKTTASGQRLILVNPMKGSVNTNFDIDILGTVNQQYLKGIANASIDYFGAKFDAQAVFDNEIEPIQTINQVIVSAKQLNVDKLIAAMPKAKTQAPPPSVIINKGKFSAKELISSNLVLNDVSLDFDLNKNHIVTVNNLTSNLAGGTIRGVADYNLVNTLVRTDVVLNNIETNYLATNLSNMKDEIFGKLNGRAQISTSGTTEKQQTANLSGVVDFDIQNGRLKKLGSLNYLLGAQNILSGGISLPQLGQLTGQSTETEYFRTLNGHLEIRNGVVDISPVKSQGNALSLLIEGQTNLNNNYGDIVVLGNLSSKIANRLGPLKRFGMEKVFKELERHKAGKIFSEFAKEYYGYQETKKEDYDTSKIPALLRQSEGDRIFAVKIRGNMASPTSVKDFTWVK